jgi:hypothetical protein
MTPVSHQLQTVVSRMLCGKPVATLSVPPWYAHHQLGISSLGAMAWEVAVTR